MRRGGVRRGWERRGGQRRSESRRDGTRRLGHIDDAVGGKAAAGGRRRWLMDRLIGFLVCIVMRVSRYRHSTG